MMIRGGSYRALLTLRSISRANWDFPRGQLFGRHFCRLISASRGLNNRSRVAISQEFIVSRSHEETRSAVIAHCSFLRLLARKSPPPHRRHTSSLESRAMIRSFLCPSLPAPVWHERVANNVCPGRKSEEIPSRPYFREERRERYEFRPDLSLFYSTFCCHPEAPKSRGTGVDFTRCLIRRSILQIIRTAVILCCKLSQLSVLYVFNWWNSFLEVTPEKFLNWSHHSPRARRSAILWSSY